RRARHRRSEPLGGYDDDRGAGPLAGAHHRSPAIGAGGGGRLRAGRRSPGAALRPPASRQPGVRGLRRADADRAVRRGSGQDADDGPALAAQRLRVGAGRRAGGGSDVRRRPAGGRRPGMSDAPEQDLARSLEHGLRADFPERKRTALHLAELFLDAVDEALPLSSGRGPVASLELLAQRADVYGWDGPPGWDEVLARGIAERGQVQPAPPPLDGLGAPVARDEQAELLS